MVRGTQTRGISTPIPHGDAADVVFSAVRESIIAGSIAPGTRLGEEDLARQFSVSRTPVREAVLRLEAEGLAERAPRRGLVVAHVSEQEILELYVVRESIEALSAGLAAESRGLADVIRLRAINELIENAAGRNDARAMARLNLDFHESLCAAGHNTVLLQLMKEIHDRVRRFQGTTFWTTFSNEERAVTAVREHTAIIEAVEQQSIDTAQALARRHIQGALHIRISMLPADSARQP